MGKKQFKTESKRILDLMVNSIYTHKEIFLRELVSNASDAIDKLSYRALTDDSVGLNRDDFKITIKLDRDARTLTISDNGIGMTGEELESNLGVIARSGSLQFKNELSEAGTEDMPDIIGQFGVGFYSAFMVAEKVAVLSRAFGSDDAFMWVSTGADGYTVTKSERDAAGTDIMLLIKQDTEEENYSEFLEEYRIKELIKKYSDYVRWPIVMGDETVNSMTPIWQRPKSEVSDDDCKAFYKETFHDFSDPAGVIRIDAEGTVSYKALLFIPSAAPYNFYTTAFKPGLQLYTNGVMIMDKCADLIPEHFRFVQGVVDSPDVSLNISRELLQHDRQLKVIANNIEKKVKAELKRLLDKERDKYEEFFKSFGIQLKYGIMNDFGMKKDMLSDLLLFWSSRREKMITLDEYVDAMPEDQKYIYYACGDSIAAANGLPQTEPIRDAGFDFLCFTEGVDEFAVQMLGAYKEKSFKSVNDDDLGLESDDEKEKTDELESENKELLDFIVESLGGKISEAKISHRLKTHPVCLTASGPISLDMEKYFKDAPAQGEKIKAQRVLELNAAHPAFEALKQAYVSDRDRAADYAKLLYAQAQLIAGIMPDDPTEMTDLVCSLMK